MPLDAISPYADLMDRHGFIPADHARPSESFFPVSARRIFDEQGTQLPGYLRITRDDTNTTLDMVSDGYQVVTNEEAFTAFEDSLAKSSLDLEGMRIGTDYAAGGARCFRQYLLPAHSVEVKRGVTVALRLLMMNSYDRSLAFKGQCGAYNFVCANTSISGTDFAKFSMKHNQSLDVVSAIEGLTRAAEQHVLQAERWQNWPRIGIADTDALAIFKAIPVPTNALMDHLAHRWIIARDQDETQGGANLWTLFNVLTAWSTHGELKDTASLRNPGHAATAAGRGQVRFDRESRVARLLQSETFKHYADA